MAWVWALGEGGPRQPVTKRAGREAAGKQMGRRRLEIKEVIGSGVPQPSAAHDSPGHGVCIGGSRSTRDACPPMPLVVMLDVCRLERDGGSRGRAS